MATAAIPKAKRKIPTGVPTAAALRIAAAMTSSHQKIEALKNATPWRGSVGAPFKGGAPINDSQLGLGLVVQGSPVDLVKIAITPPPWFGSAQPGQTVINNWLNTAQNPFNDVFPEGLGLYISAQLSDVYPGLVTALYEGILCTLVEDNNPGGYIPMLALPPGTRMERHVSTTASNTTAITEGLGALYPEGLYATRNDLYWKKNTTTISFTLQSTTALINFLATLGTAGITVPAMGAYMLLLGYGYQLRQVGTKN
jgi:hypothetical protein